MVFMVVGFVMPVPMAFPRMTQALQPVSARSYVVER